VKALVVNAGSSTLKLSLFDMPATVLSELAPPPLWQSTLETGTASDTARLAAINSALSSLWENGGVLAGPGEIDVVGHRVVHGGHKYIQPVFVDTAVKAAIAALAEFAPLHNPVNLAGICALEQALPGVKQVAVFDTAFHGTLPPYAYIFPGPYSWFADLGIRRFGFHGISHGYVASRAAQVLKRDPSELRTVTCHLGNGCSLAAVAGGRCIETTMGFTPLDGLMMGTRSGSVDPGVLFYLLKKCTPAELDHTLNYESGLQGISGRSADMREIIECMQSGCPRSQLAFDMFVHILAAAIAAMTASLGGLDVLVFTAGIGENAPLVRQHVCSRLGYLGISLDAGRNASSPVDEDIAAAGAQARVLVVHTREDWAVATECWRLVKAH
jgi:acetate kinase